MGLYFILNRFDYKCVVYGWDPFCKMSEEWINQMGVDTDLSRGRNQPFYNVLVSDGSERYASQGKFRGTRVFQISVSQYLYLYTNCFLDFLFRQS